MLQLLLLLRFPHFIRKLKSARRKGGKATFLVKKSERKKLGMNKKLILNILLVFFIILLIYSLINIITWFIDANKTDEQIQKLQDIAQVEETDEIQVSEKLKNEENSRENISTKMMKVDFT